MRINVQIIIDNDDQKIVKDISCLERQDLSAETLGLTLEEAKVITSGIQETMTAYQVSQYTHNQRTCQCCGNPETTRFWVVSKITSRINQRVKEKKAFSFTIFKKDSKRFTAAA